MVNKKTCRIVGCSNPVHASGYCNRHNVRRYYRMKRGLPFDDAALVLRLPPNPPKGQRNARWNGGKSEYPNHYLMKKIRLKVLKEANYRCQRIKEDGQICGKPANEIHHKDKDKSHQAKENFLAVCRKCQIGFHIDEWGRKPKYGQLTLREMSLITGLSTATICNSFCGIRTSLRTKRKMSLLNQEKSEVSVNA